VINSGGYRPASRCPMIRASAAGAGARFWESFLQISEPVGEPFVLKTHQAATTSWRRQWTEQNSGDCRDDAGTTRADHHLSQIKKTRESLQRRIEALVK